MTWAIGQILLNPIAWWVSDSHCFDANDPKDPNLRMIQDTDKAWNSYHEYQGKFGMKLFPEYPNRDKWYTAVVMALLEGDGVEVVCTGK